MSIVAFSLALGVGVLLGLLGGGGSILTVPILVYALGFDAKQAIVGSLVVVGLSSLAGTIGHWRAGRVTLRLAVPFGLLAMVGTYLGARLAILLSGSAQLALFGIVMLVAAFALFRKSGSSGAPDVISRQVDPPVRAALLALAGEGLGVGLLSGLVGVGGGFLIVPALVLMARVPMKEAVGTSLMVIAMSSAAGLIGYLGQVSVRWDVLGGFSAAAIIGILAGTAAARFVPARALQRSFAVFLVLMGVFMVYENRFAFAWS